MPPLTAGWYDPCSGRRMRINYVVLCLLLATGCAEKTVVGPTARLEERFTIEAGQTATIEPASVKVLFMGVTGDSRCPADVVFIQGGDAIVHVRATGGGSMGDYELHTGDSARATATHGSLRIALVELQPYPFSSRTIAPGDYRATLRVTR